MIRVPMHLVHRPDTRADLVADRLGAWRFEGQALPLAARARVLEHLGRAVQLEGPGAPDQALDGGTEVSLSPASSEAALCAALVGLAGATGVVVVWAEVQGLPVTAAA